MTADHDATNDPNNKPPGHLSNRAAALWRDVVPRRAKTPGRMAMVQTALEALDRADAARKAVEVAGMTTTTKTTGAVHVHPLVKVERESRAQFTKVWETLNLSFEYAAGDRRPVTGDDHQAPNGRSTSSTTAFCIRSSSLLVRHP